MEKRVKIFKERPTLFEHLKQVDPSFRTIFLLQFSLFIVYILARDSLRARQLHIDLSNDILTLGRLSEWWTFARVECFLLLSYLLMYTAFLVWASLRRCLGRIADVLYFTLYTAYFCGTFYVVWSTVESIAPVPRLVAFSEQLRISAKCYSFLRENMRKVLHPWNKDDDSGPAVWYAGQMSPRVGSFSQYVYFLFVPTLLYRDHYPRNRSPFTWTNVALHALQFLGACLVAKVFFSEFQYPVSMKLEDLVESYLKCLLCAPFATLLTCIIFFDSWYNLNAELTRFGDREFYQNWWSVEGHPEFHRRWNIFVYDFFRTYIYQEISPWMPHQLVGVLFVFVFSSVLHDFYVGITMGFFLPVFICLYAIIGGAILLSGVQCSKLVTYLTVCIGWFMIETILYTELAARHYCPADNIGKFELRTIYCYFKHNS